MPKTKKEVKKSQSFLSQIKWGESYTSLFLGAVVVVVGLILLFSFLKAGNVMKQQTDSTATKVEQKILPTTYTVKSGEDLWTISQKIYGSGYNWVDIADANKLDNPSVLYVGTKLTVPDVKPKIVDVKEANPVSQTVTQNSYKVVEGDHLWSIALRAYGDGYKWVNIAKANNLTNPDVIHVGIVLILPR